MTVRIATGADLPAINLIYNHYVLHSTCTYQEVAEPLALRQTWFQHHGERHPAVVVEAAGQVLGWGSLSPFHSRTAFRFTVEDSVYIHPDHQRRGLGRLILTDLIQRARTLGYHTIIAAISAEQTGSIRLHEALGFQKAAHFREVGYKFNQWLDVVDYQLMLDPIVAQN
jgi:phosphinothricin acetyltransferase